MIQKTQELSRGSADPGIPCCRVAVLFLLDQPHFTGIGADKLGGGIGRSVVNDENLQRPVLLRENAVERLGDVSAAVVRRNYDADQSVHSFAPSVSPM